MLNHKVSAATLTVTLAVAIGAARADEPTAPAQSQPTAPAADHHPAPPIPPHVEGQPVMAAGGGYCYVGPHPTDTRVTGGATFDESQGAHLHEYAPIDLRLFTFRDGCYYFIGDPRDFGYGNRPTYSYYGAHPVLETYGGGWCFMMGGHHHLWQPWSPYFTVVGPWHYWQGPYDPFFWSYWPYYSFYYRSYYPHYYAGGRYYRGGYRPAPPIRRVPPTGGWRGAPPAMAGAGAGGAPTGWRGSPAGATTQPLRSGTGVYGGGAPGGGWRGSPGAVGSGVRSYSSPLGASPPSTGGGWRGGGGGAPSGGGGGGWRRR